MITAEKNNIQCTLDLHKNSNSTMSVDVKFTFSVGGYVPEGRTISTTFSPETSKKIKDARLARIDKFIKESSETTICY